MLTKRGDRARDRRAPRHGHRGRNCRRAERAQRLNRDHVLFTCNRVIRVRTAYGIKHRGTRLLEAGLLMPTNVARRYGVKVCIVTCGGAASCYERVPPMTRVTIPTRFLRRNLPRKFAHKGNIKQSPEPSGHATHEVQYVQYNPSKLAYISPSTKGKISATQGASPPVRQGDDFLDASGVRSKRQFPSPGSRAASCQST